MGLVIGSWGEVREVGILLFGVSLKLELFDILG